MRPTGSAGREGQSSTDLHGWFLPVRRRVLVLQQPVWLSLVSGRRETSSPAPAGLTPR